MPAERLKRKDFRFLCERWGQGSHEKHVLLARAALLPRFYLFAVLVLFGIKLTAAQPAMNVLFIAIDDLKPVLGCYRDQSLYADAES